MTLTVRPIGDRETTDALVTQQPRTRFLQTWLWGSFQQAMGHDVQRLGIFQDDRLVGVGQLIAYSLPLGRRYWYCPHGPVVLEAFEQAYGDILRALRYFVREHLPAVFLRAEPLLPPDRADRLRSRGWLSTLPMQPQHTWVLDLAPDAERLLQAMHHKTRYNIRLAERKGVTVRSSANPQDAALFHGLIATVNRRAGIRSFDQSYYRHMMEILGREGAAECLFAEYQGLVIAGILLVHAGDTTTYNHGGSLDASREVMAPHLLQWHGIQRARARGSRWYDFRGIASPTGSGSDDPQDPWAGITRFKKGFGGFAESLAGTWDMPFARGQYALYRTLRSLGRRLR
ncbi:MAG: peptidoglycan bridge formation glycyltransferase FemA/FemB family protein [Candidatus Kerfeldbacteria bacterium]|nr:peptidoglycan bridge formation glycyltransferase FemA/FemB family protein [Candidatus Kerfeldbacteria bacterium]